MMFTNFLGRAAFLFAIMYAGVSFFACGSAATEHPEWKSHFDSGALDGCLTIYDQNADRFHRYNPARCAQGFLPASTFKVFNSLVALETGVAPDADFELKWDGQTRDILAWNQDHTMRSAMQVSTVWYYQELARRIGADRMRDYLTRAGYGNGDISAGIDRFWLFGSFRVAPEAQIDFLRRLHADALPFSARNQGIVKTILINEETAEYTLYAKTGLSIRDSGHKIGWWIGYLEQNDNVFFFVLNIAGTAEEEFMEFAGKRQSIVTEILRSRFNLL